MSFDTILYMTKAQFDAKESAFVEAVKIELGMSTVDKISAVATESTSDHIVSKTVTVTTTVNLEGSTAGKPGFSPSTFVTHLRTQGVSTVIPDGVVMATSGVSIPIFTAIGSVLDVKVPTYQKVEGIVSFDDAKADQIVTLQLEFATALTATQKVKVKTGIAKTAGVPIDNVKMTKMTTSRRASNGGKVSYDVEIVFADASKATEGAGKLTAEALNAELTKLGAPTATIKTKAAVSSPETTPAPPSGLDAAGYQNKPTFGPVMTTTIGVLSALSLSGL